MNTYTSTNRNARRSRRVFVAAVALMLATVACSQAADEAEGATPTAAAPAATAAPASTTAAEPAAPTSTTERDDGGGEAADSVDAADDQATDSTEVTEVPATTVPVTSTTEAAADDNDTAGGGEEGEADEADADTGTGDGETVTEPDDTEPDIEPDGGQSADEADPEADEPEGDEPDSEPDDEAETEPDDGEGEADEEEETADDEYPQTPEAALARGWSVAQQGNAVHITSLPTAGHVCPGSLFPCIRWPDPDPDLWPGETHSTGIVMPAEREWYWVPPQPLDAQTHRLTLTSNPGREVPYGSCGFGSDRVAGIETGDEIVFVLPLQVSMDNCNFDEVMIANPGTRIRVINTYRLNDRGVEAAWVMGCMYHPGVRVLHEHVMFATQIRPTSAAKHAELVNTDFWAWPDVTGVGGRCHWPERE